LYCGEETNSDVEKKKNVERRRTVYPFRELHVVDSIRTVAARRNDKEGREILKRLADCIDLVAKSGVYHDDCRKEFFRDLRPCKRRGRPEDEYVKEAMDHIFSVLENGDDCQYSLSELLANYDGYVPDTRTIKKKLLQKYGDGVIVASNQKSGTIVCLRSAGMKILTEQWYSNKLEDATEERMRIVRTAARIIKEDMNAEVVSCSCPPLFFCTINV